MTLQRRMDEADPPHTVRSAAEDLVARKAVTKEMGVDVVPPVLREFILGEIADQYWLTRASDRAHRQQAREHAEAFFREAVTNHGPRS